MDIVKLIIVCFIHILFSTAHAAVFDMGEHSGIIRDSNGNFSQVSANGSVRSLTSNTALSIAEKVNFQTSKGVFSTDIVRTALVDTARIGKTVRGLAVAGGPIGMTVTAVSLVCELTDICQNGSDWLFGVSTTELTVVNCSSVGTGLYTKVTGGIYNDYKQMPCSTPSPPSGWNVIAECNCPFDYKIIQSTPYNTPHAAPHVPTSEEWDSKESLLNDPRFTPELHAKDQPIPVQMPSLPSPVTVPIGNTTKTLKDGSGNVTGTESEITEAKIEQPSQGENPTGNPNILKLTETTINNTYNTNNQLTSSTTTTNTGPQQPQPQSFEIEIDNMVDQPLEQQAVPGTFSYTSWGSGSCPADRSVNYHYGTLTLTFEPACDLAVMANPVVIAIAGLAALFIVSGAVRND